MDVPATPVGVSPIVGVGATSSSSSVRLALQPRDPNAQQSQSQLQLSKRQLHCRTFSESLAKLREAETKKVTSFSGWLTKNPVV